MKMTAFRDVTPSSSVYVQEKLPTPAFMVKEKQARTFWSSVFQKDIILKLLMAKTKYNTNC
jgi:hypothetical protein